VVLMIDACHSGAIVKDVKGLLQNRIYTQLGRSTGFAVLAAARQDQARWSATRSATACSRRPSWRRWRRGRPQRRRQGDRARAGRLLSREQIPRWPPST
jgi:hypothetical protein